MASTISPSTLTVTIQESVIINNKERGSKNVLNIQNVTDVEENIISVPATGFDGAVLYKPIWIPDGLPRTPAYARITCLDDTDPVQIRFADSLDAQKAIDITIGPGESLTLGAFGPEDGTQLPSGGYFAAAENVNGLEDVRSTAPINKYLLFDAEGTNVGTGVWARTINASAVDIELFIAYTAYAAKPSHN